MKTTPLARRGLLARLLSYLPLLFILIAGGVVRIWFYKGVVTFEELQFAQAAADVLQGKLSFISTAPAVSMHPGVYVPVALAYAVLGVSETSTLLFVFCGSVLLLGMVYLTGRQLAGHTAGLLAAALWAFMPLDIKYATTLATDGPLTLCLAAFLLFYLKAQKTPGKKAALFYSLAGTAYLLAGLVVPAILAAVPLILVYSLRRFISRPLFVSGLAACFLLAVGVAGSLDFFTASGLPLDTSLAALIQALGEGLGSIILSLFGRSDLFFIMPFLLAALTFAILQKIGASETLVFFLVAWMPFILPGKPVNSILGSDPQNLLPLLLLLVLSASVFLANISPWTQVVPTLTLLVAGAAAIWIFGESGQSSLPDWLSGANPLMQPVIMAARLCTAVTIFGGLASPAITALRNEKVKRTLTAGLFGMLLLAAFEPAHQVIREEKVPAYTYYDQAAGYVLGDKTRYPVFTSSLENALRLNYETGFAYTFDYFNPAGEDDNLLVSPEKIAQVPAAYLFIDETTFAKDEKGRLQPDPLFSALPPSAPELEWWLRARWGKNSGQQVKLYWHTQINASLLEEVTRIAQASPNEENYANLLEAATNAGRYCVAASAWQQSLSLKLILPDTFDLRPVIEGCYQQNPAIAGDNLLNNGDFSAGLQGWTYAGDWSVITSLLPESDSPANTLQIQKEPGDWKVIAQSVTLHPGTWYLYAASVKTTVPVTVLYWESDKVDYLQSKQAYPEWTELRFFFYIPQGNKDVTATLYPLLMDAPGMAWIKAVRLVELNLSGE